MRSPFDTFDISVGVESAIAKWTGPIIKAALKTVLITFFIFYPLVRVSCSKWSRWSISSRKMVMC